MTFTDNMLIKALDPETLEPIGVTDQAALNPELDGPLSAAHAQFDSETGDMYNFNLKFGRECIYRIFRTSRTTGETEILATIQGTDIKPAYIHSTFLTRDFFILAIWSSHFAAGGSKILEEGNLLDAFVEFDTDAETVWVVVDRRHGRGVVAKFNGPAKFCFHSVNAWQEEELDGKINIFCDLIQYSNIEVIRRFYYGNILSTGSGAASFAGNCRDDVRPSLARYLLRDIPANGVPEPKDIPVSKAEVVLNIDGPLVGELPTINPIYAMKKNRFVYSVVDQGHSSWVDAIAKTDLQTQKSVIWETPHHTPGEPIFVPHLNGTHEDDGVA
ncbi:carotenoid oxygenase [Xylogone sp. PMI_703]|nr:carotenoid oxygenase [Xylogone sp. PMI_703]